MKIGPNHDPRSIIRPDEKNVEFTQRRQGPRELARPNEGHGGPEPKKQPEDSVYLSRATEPNENGAGYDSRELRDGLAAQSPASGGKAEASGRKEIDLDRIEKIRNLIEIGFYDHEDVREWIVERLTDEFLG